MSPVLVIAPPLGRDDWYFINSKNHVKGFLKQQRTREEVPWAATVVDQGPAVKCSGLPESTASL
jgi:hypothetical protein